MTRAVEIYEAHLDGIQKGFLNALSGDVSKRPTYDDHRGTIGDDIYNLLEESNQVNTAMQIFADLYTGDFSMIDIEKRVKEVIDNCSGTLRELKDESDTGALDDIEYLDER